MATSTTHQPVQQSAPMRALPTQSVPARALPPQQAPTRSLSTKRSIPTLTLALMLLRGRAAEKRATIDILTVLSSFISTSLLLSVVAGARTFALRQANPPQAFVDAAGGDPSAIGMLSVWTFLACGAALLLIVPLLTLSSAAARMGALGRDQRLSALRLLGVTAGGATRLTVVETMGTATLGSLLGVIGYFGLLPLWSTITFEGARLTMSEMLLPAVWIVGVVVGIIVLAGIASVTGLRQVRISPLGVARRATRQRIRWQRLLFIPLVIVAWLAIAPLLSFSGNNMTQAIMVTLVVLACFMGVVNLIGPLILKFVGFILIHFNSATTLLAARRIMADPRGAWRNVSGLAFVGFIGGAVVALPSQEGVAGVGAILGDDIRTGTLLTVVIAFVTAAASTAINQTAAVLDRRAVLVQLDHAGAPRSLIHRTRLWEVLIPTLCASIGSAGLSSMFFLWLQMVAKQDGDPNGFYLLAGIIAAGVILVVAASECCRPIVRSILSGAGARAE